jgi:hypothetical protein
MTDDYEELDEMLANAPHWLFEISVDNQPRGRVFGPKDKRNWVLWRLSKYAIEFEAEGIVSVRRYINGKWEKADDWRNLSH